MNKQFVQNQLRETGNMRQELKTQTYSTLNISAPPCGQY